MKEKQPYDFMRIKKTTLSPEMYVICELWEAFKSTGKLDIEALKEKLRENDYVDKFGQCSDEDLVNIVESAILREALYANAKYYGEAV